MKHYRELLEKGCFTWYDVCMIVGNKNSASNLIQNYIKKGYVQGVKRNLYVALDLVTQEPAANKYQIASNITETAYVYGFSALDYHGYANQVTYTVYTASDTRFLDFEYAGIIYKYVKSSANDGVVTENNVKVTDVEKSILDCINTFEKYGGIEELFHCIELIPALNEEKLLGYLAAYNKSVLYQKTGYILEHFKNELYISDDFLDKCRSSIGKSIRYLYSREKMEQPVFNKEWQLIVPSNLADVTYQGGLDNAEI